MIIKQIKIGYSDNFTYLVGCEKTHQALVIDPQKNINPVVQKVKELKLKIIYIFNTHGHLDHTSGNIDLKIQTNAKIIMHHADALRYSNIDIQLKDETELNLGEISFKIFHTPGHTPGGVCLYTEGNLFTGDTLFVGDSGRTDLSGGDRSTLGESIRKLMELPEDTIIWPGHDYGPTPYSTLKWEKCYNINAKEYGFYDCS